MAKDFGAMIDVSCILINYNTSGFTIDAVSSILDKNDNSIFYEIIVVDNASHEKDFKNLETGIVDIGSDRVKLVRSVENNGFGAGNMLGVKNAQKCKYYAFINNDTLQATDNCLKILMDFMQSTKDAGLCSPQMLDQNGNFRTTIDHFASLQREIFKRKILEILFPKTYLDRHKTYKEPTKVQYVQGSFMFVDANDFISIGGFDTNLFLFYEESDLCLRLLRLKKKSTYLVPAVEYLHYKGASMENLNNKYEQKIALLYYIEKHHGHFNRKILQYYYIIKYFFSSLVKPKNRKIFKLVLSGADLDQSIRFNLKKPADA